MSIHAGIYGAAGYAGMALIKLLNEHPEIRIQFAASDTYADESYEGVVFSAVAETDLSQADIVFLCTPHRASAPLVKQALDAGAKVVDLSADLRLKTPEAYQKWYDVEHPHPELLPTVYGLPEFNRDHIVNQNRVANPGCYPTTSLIGLGVLASENAIHPDSTIIIDAKSGVSGAGRKPKLGTHFVEVFGDFKPYNIGRVHRHVGEIEQALTELGATYKNLIFSPHLLPIDRGLLATIYVRLANGWTLATVRELMESVYESEPLVKVLPEGQTAKIADIARQNGAILSLHKGTDDTIIIVSATDNLLKGAASQAVQNANLMLGLPETMGLV